MGAVMRRMTIARVVVCVATALFAAVVHADDDLLAAVERFGDAYRDGEVEVLAGMLTEDYVHTNSSSTPIGREKWLAWVSTRRTALDEGRLRVLEYENTDIRVVRHGDAAVVTGRNRTVSEESGATKTSSLRFTMVWVKTESGWKRAAFQDCRE
jgi:uncharacterized protein (TIGR02246 family)